MSRTSFPKIKMMGIGGAGIHILDCLSESWFDGKNDIECIGFDTDQLTITTSKTKRKMLLGLDFLHGHGAGSFFHNGRIAAEVDRKIIQRELNGADVVLLIAGFGGGTGTGAFPVIAKIAKEMNIYVAGIITTPFNFEKPVKRKCAADTIRCCKNSIDLLTIISNEKIYSSFNNNCNLHYVLQKRNSLLKKAVFEIQQIVCELLTNDTHHEIKQSKIQFIGIERRSGITVKKKNLSPKRCDDQSYFLTEILEKNTHEYKKLFVNIRNYGLSLNEIRPVPKLGIFKQHSQRDVMMNVCNEKGMFNFASMAVMGVC